MGMGAAVCDAKQMVRRALPPKQVRVYASSINVNLWHLIN